MASLLIVLSHVHVVRWSIRPVNPETVNWSSSWDKLPAVKWCRLTQVTKRKLSMGRGRWLLSSNQTGWCLPLILQKQQGTRKESWGLPAHLSLSGFGPCQNTSTSGIQVQSWEEKRLLCLFGEKRMLSCSCFSCTVKIKREEGIFVKTGETATWAMSL